MTQNNFTVQFYLFVLREKPWEKMPTLLEAAIKSETMNIEDEPANSVRLPAITYHAILCEMALRAKPKAEADLIESEFLQRFL